MFKKIISLAMLSALFALSGIGDSFSAEPAKAGAKPAQKVVEAKAMNVTPEKQAKKPSGPEDEKYPLTYSKCSKEAEADEAKYDKIFDDCMEKNGFPQEEFSAGGLPIDSGEDEQNIQIAENPDSNILNTRLLLKDNGKKK